MSDLLTFIAGRKFATIYADPPWQYGNNGTRGAATDHYETMSVEEIASLPVSSLVEDNAHLHLWTTNAFLPRAFEVISAWGFTYKSCFVWTKPHIGMGNYWRVSHEFLLFGLRGKAPFQSHSLRSWGTWARRKHSAKPEDVRKLIEIASPTPRLEIFARTKTEGWESWGREIQTCDLSTATSPNISTDPGAERPNSIPS